MTIYLVIDFECFQPNIWQSIGIVLYDRPNDRSRGKVIRYLHLSCDREHTPMTPSTKRFWQKHEEAFMYNYNHGKGKCPLEQEKRICEFISEVKRTYPNFYLISDAPEYDVGIMNSILLRHGYDTMSHRNKTTYFQSICTWSTKKTLDLLAIPIIERRIVKHNDGLMHTPISDCLHILNQYFCILETIHINKGQCIA